jgi:hypothetical protein
LVNLNNLITKIIRLNWLNKQTEPNVWCMYKANTLVSGEYQWSTKKKTYKNCHSRNRNLGRNHQAEPNWVESPQVPYHNSECQQSYRCTVLVWPHKFLHTLALSTDQHSLYVTNEIKKTTKKSMLYSWI